MAQQRLGWLSHRVQWLRGAIAPQWGMCNTLQGSDGPSMVVGSDGLVLVKNVKAKNKCGLAACRKEWPFPRRWSPPYPRHDQQQR